MNAPLHEVTWCVVVWCTCTERAEMAAVSCGTSHASAVSTPLRCYKKLFTHAESHHSSGAVWESRWTSWAVRPNEPSGFCGRKDLLNRASALVTTCPYYVNWHLKTLSINSSSSAESHGSAVCPRAENSDQQSQHYYMYIGIQDGWGVGGVSIAMPHDSCMTLQQCARAHARTHTRTHTMHAHKQTTTKMWNGNVQYLLKQMKIFTHLF